MPRSRPYVFVAAALIALVLTAICAMAPRMYPLKASTSANFWYAATRVDLGVRQPLAQYVALDRDRLVYGMQWPFAAYMDQAYQTISLQDVRADFPAVQRELARRAALNNPDDFYAAGYRKWAATDAAFQTVPALLAFIDGERKSPSPYPAYFEQGLRRVSQAARLYWATFLFEAILFSGLILLGFWPWIYRKSFGRKLLHLALLPLLLYLPMWFGYCNSASPAYPRGGILYPFCNLPAWALFDTRQWEINFLAHLPPFFMTITQGRTLSFADYYWWKNSIPNQLGPINVAAISVIIVLLAAAWRGGVILFNRFRKQPRGFPVELASARPGGNPIT